jgi:acetoacetate decarboxylase
MAVGPLEGTMGRVRFVKSMRDLERGGEPGAEGAGATRQALRSIRCVYETDAEAAQAVVPKPLEASVEAEVCVSLSCLSVEVSPEVVVEIRSARFGVRVDYDDKPGWYVLAAPMNSQQAVLTRRERFGEPAKLAEIEFDAHGESIAASVERMGVRYLGVTGRRADAIAPREETEHGYCFKAFPSCEPGKGFDQDPRLVRLEWRHDYERIWRIEGRLELRDSPFDPVADLPVRRLVQLELVEGTVQSTGRVLRPVPGDWLLPFMHQRYDEPSVDGVEI